MVPLEPFRIRPHLPSLRQTPSFFQRQAAAFGPAVVVLILGIVIVLSVHKTRANRVEINYNTRVLYTVNQLLLQLLDAETEQRGYLITGRDEHLRPFRQAVDSAAKTLDSLRGLVWKRGEGSQEASISLDTLVPTRLAELQQTIDARNPQQLEPMLTILETHRGNQVMKAIRSEIAEIRRSERGAREQSAQAEDIWGERALIIVVAGTALAGVLALLSSIFLARYAETQTQAAGESHKLSQEAVRETALQVAARAEAEAANLAKTQFLTTMSHELRTPLNAINGYTELLSLGIPGAVTPQQLNFLGRISRSGRHLLALINDILNYAKLEAGQVQLNIEDTAIDTTLREIEAMVGPQLAAKGLRYQYHTTNPNQTALADPERLSQIVLNLMSNAIKFTPLGGLITLSSDADEHHVNIYVEDTGCGIAHDKLSTIFDPFVQVDRRLTTEGSQQGVGLGLAISQDLARQMQGNLLVTSEVKQGSRFTLQLPRAQRDHKVFVSRTASNTTSNGVSQPERLARTQ